MFKYLLFTPCDLCLTASVRKFLTQVSELGFDESWKLDSRERKTPSGFWLHKVATTILVKNMPMPIYRNSCTVAILCLSFQSKNSNLHTILWNLIRIYMPRESCTNSPIPCILLTSDIGLFWSIFPFPKFLYPFLKLGFGLVGGRNQYKSEHESHKSFHNEHVTTLLWLYFLSYKYAFIHVKRVYSNIFKCSKCFITESPYFLL